MSLKLLELINMDTQDPLDDIGLGAILGHMLTLKELFAIIVIH
jgi:hypothetical protein